MKRLFSSIMIALVVSTSVPAWADPPALPPAPELQSGEPDVGPAVSPMKKGQIAPFTGVLLSPKAVATVTVNMQLIPEQVKIEVDHAVAVEKAQSAAALNEQKIKADADAKVAEARLNAALAENKIVSDRLKKVEDSQPNLWLWVGGGVIAGAGLTVLTVWASSQAQK